MKPEAARLDEMKVGDRLALERTAMAADRTLLAWVRTALSSIAFGFTIYKVLGAMAKSEGVAVIREQTPRNIGIFMILIGVVPLLLATYQYQHGMKRMGVRGNFYINPGMVSAIGVILLGIALLVVILMNLNLL